MSNFIYAIENVKMVGPSQLEEAGLNGIFETEISQRYSAAGPAGECVLLAAADIDVKLLHYKPDEQTWKKSIDGKFHIGLYKGCLLYTSPSPRDQRGSRMPSSA